MPVFKLDGCCNIAGNKMDMNRNSITHATKTMDTLDEENLHSEKVGERTQRV